jgi:nucleotidyltransferase/DNA polymerase involved in DNA repair
MQLNLNLMTREQIKRTWAFAVDKRGTARRRSKRSLADFRHCIITACSKEAKAFGIRAGMRYEEARALLPDMRILVIGDRHGNA